MHIKLAKRICALALTAIMALFWSSSAFAASHIVDYTKVGTLTITPRDTKTQEPVLETTFALYFIGHLGKIGHSIYFEKTSDFSGYTDNINNTNTISLAESLATYTDAAEIDAYMTASADETGTVTFSDLPLGLYLVVQIPSSSSNHSTAPFLITIPIADPGTGYWLYEIDASPKTSAASTPSPTEPPTPTNMPPADKKLPQTGMLMWPIPVLTGIGLLLFLAGWILNKRESDET